MPEIECRRLTEERRDLLGERLAQLGEVLARLETADQLGGRAHADVGVDQRLFEPLPRGIVARIERGDRQLLGECPARLPERFTQAAEETALFDLALRRRIGIAQQLSPAPRHDRGTFSAQPVAATSSSRGSRRETICETPSVPIVTP